MTERPSWDEYFLGVAKQAATRGTCTRKQVGAVLVRGRVILCTGYNGSIAGAPHCDEAGCLMESNHCIRTVHAESNAIAQAAREAIRVDGAFCYTTASPCWQCMKLLANAGIKQIIYAEAYRMDTKVLEHSKGHSWDPKLGMGVLLL